MSRPSVLRPMVADALKRHGRKHVTRAEIALETGLTEDQVSHAVLQLRRDPAWGRYIEVVRRGHIWMYDPTRPNDGNVAPPPPSKRGVKSKAKDEVKSVVDEFNGLVPTDDSTSDDNHDPAQLTFSYVGNTRDGELVLQATDGRLFRAIEL